MSVEVGQAIPSETPHAVSVCLPTWKSCVAYEEGEDWVVSRMKNGYPRFFVDNIISELADAIVKKYADPRKNAYLFPSHTVAARCVAFFKQQVPALDTEKNVNILELFSRLNPLVNASRDSGPVVIPTIAAVIFPKTYSKVAQTFWQHSGDGVSSRRAELCHKAFDDGYLVARDDREQNPEKPLASPHELRKGPRRYQKERLPNTPQASSRISETGNGILANPKGLGGKEHVQFLEERYGRNLDTSLASSAKLAIRRRIAGALTADVDLHEALKVIEKPLRMQQVQGFSEDDVYLWPSGMSSIFNTHRTMMACRGAMKSVSYGFPYIDTLKILEKFGPGCVFYGHGSSQDLDDLERRCQNGDKFLALFCEFPGNPLLASPDLERIRSLADRYDFAVVVDETIGNLINIHVLPFADVVVSSLTKVFSGDSNVMGGCSILNPNRKYYDQLKAIMEVEYEDNYWAEDAIFMERNSRDFISRIERINANAEAICHTLMASPVVKQVYYPKYNKTRPFYDRCRNPNGGYGGLLSVTFWSTGDAIVFYDNLDTEKGPSLGTNFTLSSPYVLLAHYNELEWAAQFGVEPDLVRSSVGLEDAADLTAIFDRALAAVVENKSRRGNSR